MEEMIQRSCRTHHNVWGFLFFDDPGGSRELNAGTALYVTMLQRTKTKKQQHITVLGDNDEGETMVRRRGDDDLS